MPDGVFYERVELPSGAWADLRPGNTVTERQRRPVNRLMNGIDRSKFGQDDPQWTDDELERLEQLNDVVAAACVAAWSYEWPITVDSVQDLPSGDYDALRAAVAPKILDMFPGSQEAAADPKAQGGG